MEPFIFWILLLSGILKLCITAVCLNTGWRGGHIFPIIFSGSSIGYAVASILPIDPVASVAIVTTAISSYALRKPIAITLLLLMFSRLIYYCPCLVQLLSGMPFHSQNITKIKLIKIGSGDESSTVYFITHAASITLLTPQNYALHMSV